MQAMFEDQRTVNVCASHLPSSKDLWVLVYSDHLDQHQRLQSLVEALVSQHVSVGFLPATRVFPLTVEGGYKVVPQSEQGRLMASLQDGIDALIHQHCNITMLSIAYRLKRVRETVVHQTEEVCLQVCVATKSAIPIGEEQLPRCVNGIPVDVCSAIVSSINSNHYGGTAGGFLKDAANNLYLCTSYPVVSDVRSSHLTEEEKEQLDAETQQYFPAQVVQPSIEEDLDAAAQFRAEHLSAFGSALSSGCSVGANLESGDVFCPHPKLRRYTNGMQEDQFKVGIFQDVPARGLRALHSLNDGSSYGLDVAVVPLHPTVRITGAFAQPVTEPGAWPQPSAVYIRSAHSDDASPFYKYGARTGRTAGILECSAMALSTDGWVANFQGHKRRSCRHRQKQSLTHSIVFANQYVVKALKIGNEFVAEGDSGSWVVSANPERTVTICLGVLHMKLSHSFYNAGVICPMHAVLDYFAQQGLSLSFCSP